MQKANALAIDLDHIGFIVEDLIAARDLFTDLGFALTQRADHTRTDAQGRTVSAGSSQHSIMLGTGYIELMQITDRQAGHQLTPAIDHRYGMHVLALGTSDASACHGQCARNGLHPRQVMDWSRPVSTPERSGMARFLYFDAPWQATDPSYVCWVQHVTPELVRSPSLLRHSNGAQALAGLTYDGPAAALLAWSKRLQDAGAQVGPSEHKLRLGDSWISLQTRETVAEVLPSALTLSFSSLDDIARRAERLQLPRLHDSPERVSLDLRQACGLVLHAVLSN
jgi:catechol 2,3-dioxygenase-like lactoylglutathione lyase family enzyme